MPATKRCPMPCLLFALVSITVGVAAPALSQTFNSLHSFDNADGQYPAYSPLVQGPDGNFYGTTLEGGGSTACLHGCGTVFKVTPTGELTTLYSFCAQSSCPDGNAPYGGLVLASNGMFYGMTGFGGSDWGTIYRISPAGVFTTVHAFNGTDGAYGLATLMQASDGNLYGVAANGGAYSVGSFFRLTLDGTFTTLASFNTFNGASPASALIEVGGAFYGTADQGGALGYGTVYKVTPTGVITGLHSFRGVDGRNPAASLVAGSNGKLYGTTQFGGSSAACKNGCGTVFEISASGSFATVHSFEFVDGSMPSGALIRGSDGNLYGTTQNGGSGCVDDCGTIFQIFGTQFVPLYAFSSGLGDTPYTSVTEGTNGTLYGTTLLGGAGDDGTIFSLSTGLAAFIAPIPASGRVGVPVMILGNDLQQATSVTFNGTSAAFTVLSSTAITATVPAGATTGTIQVTTPAKTLSSNAVFQVAP